MRKKFGLLNTIFWGLLMFMLLNLSNVHAATLDWGTADAEFRYHASISGVIPFPSNNIAAEGEHYTTKPGSAIYSVANALVANPLPGVILTAQASGSVIPDGASSSALVSFDFQNDISSSSIINGSAASWVKRKGLTVDAPSLFDLNGFFGGEMKYTDSTGGVTASHNYIGGVFLEEVIEDDLGGPSSLNQICSLTINEILNGILVKPVVLDNETDDGNAIHYNLLVGFNGTGLTAALSNYPGESTISNSTFYELGNSETPLYLEGYLTSQVPLPGTLILLFSGIAGLFGFKLSPLRRGSSNN